MCKFNQNFHSSIGLRDIDNLEATFAEFGGESEGVIIWLIPQWLIDLRLYVLERDAVKKLVDLTAPMRYN